MKQSSKPAKRMPQTIRKPAGSTPLLLWAGLVLCLLVAGSGTWAIMEFVVWNKLPSALVGKWVVVGGEQDGATFDFFRNGTMQGRINMGGNEGIINAHVAVEENTLFITTHNPRNGREETKKHVIQTLNARELVLQDDRNNTFRMERADR